MSNYTQEGGLIKIDTPLGEDVLLLRGFKGTESISRLFRFELDLLSENSSISFPDIIGKNVTLSLKQPDGSYRYINGIISRFAQQATEERLTAYRAEMVPWLWLLTRNADCRIFKNKSIPDIITQVFSDLDFNDYTNSLQDSYEPREYCVQYRESSFNFVSRLMEQCGIFYFFNHEQGKHTLVMADSPTAHSSCPGQSSIRYFTVSGGPQEDVITGWQIEQELRAGKYTHTDYNFKTPSTSLMASEPTVHEVGGNSKLEIYDYPGEHLTKGSGQALAKIRMQEEEAQHLIAHGTSHCRMFVSGYKFTLEEHPRQDMNTDYVLTEIQHTAVTDAFPSSGNPEGESYSNTFTCIPLSVPFRPLRVTPRTAVHSLMPGTVFGEAGGEIYTDGYGRVMVMFAWDRNGEGSALCRVTQLWAGNKWGAMFVPRIGMEVYVDFEEGHTDNPVVVGCVYNDKNMPPDDLPDEGMKSGIKTHSTVGGGDDDYNCLRFDDAIGDEEVLVRARKNMITNVLNDDGLWVAHDQTIHIDHDRTEIVGGNDKITVQKSQTTTATQSITLQVGQSSIVLNQKGVTIKGLTINIQASTALTLQGLPVKIN